MEIRTTPLLEPILPQKDPVVVYWPSVFLEARGTTAIEPQFFRKTLVHWPSPPLPSPQF